MSTKTETKPFQPNVGFWPTKKGTGYSVFITKDVIKALTKLAESAEEGGRLFFGEALASENPKSPTNRLTVFPPNADFEGSADRL